MKHKGLFVFTLFLFIISLSCTILGYKRHTDNIKNHTIENSNIVFEYYLEDIKLTAMPINETSTSEEEDNGYLFNRYSCTNGITGSFDSKNWKFNATGNDGTCKIYFVNSKYEVVFNVVNGLQDENNDKTVLRENNGSFKIIPYEGYEFKSVACANEKEATWNELDNTININAITSNVACSIIFDKKELDVEVVVVNGKGNTTEKAVYGSNKTIMIEPSVGYDEPTIECSNEQIATYNNKNLSFEKITDNTKCTITFNKKKLPTYTVKINNLADFTSNNHEVNITKGTESNTVESGNSVEIIVKNIGERDVKLSCGDVIPQENDMELGVKKFTFYSVTKNINCNLEFN